MSVHESVQNGNGQIPPCPSVKPAVAAVGLDLAHLVHPLANLLLLGKLLQLILANHHPDSKFMYFTQLMDDHPHSCTYLGGRKRNILNKPSSAMFRI